MIVIQGGRFGAYGLFLSKANSASTEAGSSSSTTSWTSSARWGRPSWNRHTVAFEWTPEGPGLGKGGSGVLTVNGKEVARNTMEHSTSHHLPRGRNLRRGLDTHTGVALLEYRYDPPFKFTGKIDQLTFELGPDQASEAKK